MIYNTSSVFEVLQKSCCIDHDMDGNAIVAAFASTPGPDCLRDVLPKVGQRMKVYMAMKRMMEVYIKQ